MKYFMRASAFTACLLVNVSTVAIAQTTPTPSVSEGEASADIVVTAQRRKERLQDVPLAVSVVGTAQLAQQNVTMIQDIARVAPGVEFQGIPGNDARPAIRGISTSSYGITAENAVALVLDGVVLGRSPPSSLFDVARIEVLRGPQGTLFGKNASAGVINIVTNAPDPSKFEVIGHADLGFRFGQRLLQGVVNVPIASNVAVRVSGGQTYQRGLLTNVITGKEDRNEDNSVRGRLLWNVNDDVTVNLSADYEKSKVGEQSYRTFASHEGAAIPGCDITPSAFNRLSCSGTPSFVNLETYGFSGQLDWTIGGHTLTSITAYRAYNQEQQTDVDAKPADTFHNGNIFENHVLSQEVRLASPVGHFLEYVGGAYFSDAKVDNIYTASIRGNASRSDATATTKSLAGFANLTANITDRLKLIGGARITRDEVKLVSQNIVPLTVRLIGEEKKTNFSWRLGTQYNFTRDLMTYASATKGYKGVQLSLTQDAAGLTVQNVVKPEYPMAYEIGVKASLFDRKLSINADIFHTKVKGFQSQVFDPTANSGGGTYVVGNVPFVKTKGVEVDIVGRPFTGLTLNVGGIFNRATYSPGYEVACSANPGTPCGTNGRLDIGGKQLIMAPKWKGTFAGEYKFKIDETSEAYIQSDVVYRSKIVFNANQDPRLHNDSLVTVGGRLGVRVDDGRFGIALYGRNLFNTHYSSFLAGPVTWSLPPNGVATSSVGTSLSIDAYRVIGISVDMRF